MFLLLGSFEKMTMSPALTISEGDITQSELLLPSAVKVAVSAEPSIEPLQDAPWRLAPEQSAGRYSKVSDRGLARQASVVYASIFRR